MRHTNQPGMYGALLLAACLISHAIYELILYPNAGFPTTDFAVIIAGADTLRVGHWLKFGCTVSIALLMTAIQPRLQQASQTLAQLGLLAGASAIILFLASGHLGLRILATAAATFATNPDEAIATIRLRTVTIALFEAAGFAVGWYLLLSGMGGIHYAILPRSLSCVGCVIGLLFILARFLSNELALVAPLATIGWSLWLGYVLSVDRNGCAKRIVKSPPGSGDPGEAVAAYGLWNEKKVIRAPESDQSQRTDRPDNAPPLPGRPRRTGVRGA